MFVLEAAKILKKEKVNCRMALVGNPDFENPDPLPKSLIEQWQSEGLVEWWKNPLAWPFNHCKVAI